MVSTPTLLSPKELIQRYLYINSYRGLFVTGKSSSLSNEDHNFLFELVKTSPETFIDIMLEENKSTSIQRRENFFILLATVLTSPEIPLECKSKIKPLVLGVLKNDEEFFDFIKYFTSFTKNKITKSLKKVIVKFYKNKRPLDLAKCVTSFKGRHKWSHKDLIKLCHLKMEDPYSTLIIKYVLFGIRAIEGVDNKETQEIVNILRKSHQLHTSNDVSEAAGLIKDIQTDVWQANSKLNKSEEVWAAALPQFSLREILKRLPKLYEWGFLKLRSVCHTQIIEFLNDPVRIKQCRLHPIEVYILLRQFETGGKGIDPKFESWLNQNFKEELAIKLKNPPTPKCSILVQNINKALTLSYQNLSPTNKSIFIGVDVTGAKEDTCLHNRKITILEATATIIRCLIKTEKDVTVGVLANDTIRPVHLSKTHNIGEMIKKLTEVEYEYSLQSSCIDWALKRKKNYDVFIVFIDREWLGRLPAAHKKDHSDHPCESLARYAKKSKNARFVRVFLDGPKIAQYWSKGTKNVCTMVGFTEETPWVLDSFIRGHFS